MSAKAKKQVPPPRAELSRSVERFDADEVEIAEQDPDAKLPEHGWLIESDRNLSP